jgi:hypothetical protein
VFSLPAKIAYCTNIHPGTDLAGVRNNLSTHTLAVRRSLVASGDWKADEKLGVGLWLADSAAQEAVQGDNAQRLADWLAEHSLTPFTFNGFPQSNFHQKIVKHRVYEPTWWQAERFHYTQRLIQILDRLLPPGEVGSISTLPIAWSLPSPTHEQLCEAARHFKLIANELDRLLQSSGREIVIAIEPEPGCAITDGKSMRRFFERYLLDGPEQPRVARHLTVCHDVCHAAVMRENQAEEMAAYREQGIRIGKVQVSSAIEIDWSKTSVSDRSAAFQHLSQFAEDRYLHQTTAIQSDSETVVLHEDLPDLIRSITDPELLEGSWRVHFHVPIFLETAGPIGTTQPDIASCIDSIQSESTKASYFQSISSFTGHFEVETYAWGVLPKTHRGASLAEDIAAELRYLRALVGEKVFPQPNKSLH